MRRLALVGALALALAGCGGEDEAAAPDGGGAGVVEIRESDFALDPASVTLNEEGSYTFRAVNEGETEHALEIEGRGLEEKTDAIAPGDSAELTVTLEEGEYELYCPIADHEERGMVGRLIVGIGTGAGTDTEQTGTAEQEQTETGGGYGYGGG